MSRIETLEAIRKEIYGHSAMGGGHWTNGWGRSFEDKRSQRAQFRKMENTVMSMISSGIDQTRWEMRRK